MIIRKYNDGWKLWYCEGNVCQDKSCDSCKVMEIDGAFESKYLFDFGYAKIVMEEGTFIWLAKEEL